MPVAQERSAVNKAILHRDALIGAALFIATMGFCLWQNSRIAVLWDLSYLLDSSWRISLGQLPYRDFPFAHAPGTFLLHVLLIKVFGRVYWTHIACAALESAAATILAWRILLRIFLPLQAATSWTAASLAATLIPLGIYSIYPHAIYDGDAIFTVLLALYLVTRAAEQWDESPSAVHAGAATRNILAGAACVVPVFFKQNIGLAFLAAVLFAVVLVILTRRLHNRPIAQQLWFLIGLFAALLAAIFTIHATVGLANYRYWTMTFAASRRLPGIATILGVYHQASLLWTIPAALGGFALLRTRSLRGKLWSRILALLLLTAPFLWTMLACFFNSDPDDRADQFLSLWLHLLVLATILAIAQVTRFARARASALAALLPIFLLATIHGTFLSQQLWGSTYSIWPLLIVLIALLLLEVREIAAPLAATIAVTLLLCGSLYAISLERLDYIHLDGAISRSSLPALRGITTPGPWLSNFENLVRFAGKSIPKTDGIVLIPGEEPFYFTTGRTPQFPILLTDRATDPYTPQQTAAEMRAHNIRWLILKRDLQLTAPPEYETPELLQAVQHDFVLYRQLPGYNVYRRK